MDNYYSTVATFRYLHNMKHNAIGTARSNRICKDLFMAESAPRGVINWRITTRMNNETVDHAPILACSWKDSSVVYFLSTSHRGGETTHVQRRSGASLHNVVAPAMTDTYCIGMRGVDIADQLRASYTVRQKSRRWYMTLFYWFLDSAIVNAFICSTFCNSEEEGLNVHKQLEFRESLILSLIGYTISTPVDMSITFPPSIRRRLDTFESLPIVRVINASHLPVRKTRGRCQWCHLYQGKQSKSNYKCRDCNVNLCIDCFIPFHDFRN